jgi:iron complex outermembrane receptor protein
MLTIDLHRTGLAVAVCALARAGTLRAQTAPPSPPPTTKPDSAITLTPVQITAARADEVRVQAMQRLTLPVTASITASNARQTVNLVDPEDAVKYLPSVFLRKRNYGDT